MMLKSVALLLLVAVGATSVNAQDTQKDGADMASAPIVAEEIRIADDHVKATGVNPWDIEVTLTWHDDVDLDLRVGDPMKCEVGYDNRISCSGGMLKEDVGSGRCDRKRDKKMEMITWKLGGAIPGIYSIYAQYFSDSCRAGKVDATVRVKMGGVEVWSEDITLHRPGDQHVWYVHAHRVNTIYGVRSRVRGGCVEEEHEDDHRRVDS